MSRVVHIPERPGVGRLGRHWEPAPLSAKVSAAARWATRLARPLISKTWRRTQPPFDQADLGSCTANAYYGCLVTEGQAYRPGLAVGQTAIVSLYSAATRLDTVRGHWPPDDSGSTGLAACRAGERAGLSGGHRHLFSLSSVFQTLSHDGSVMLGITWMDSFDVPVGPGARLDISPQAESRGGHEIQANRIDVERRLIGGPNSWGPDWGDHGYWSMGWDTFERLLSERGDVMVPWQ